MQRLKYYLGKFDSYTLYRPRHKTKRYRRYVAERPGVQVELDLVDITRYMKENDGYQYLLMILDTHTRQVFVYPLLNKSLKLVVEGIDILLQNSKLANITWAHSDRGKEFTGGIVVNYFKKKSNSSL